MPLKSILEQLQLNEKISSGLDISACFVISQGFVSGSREPFQYRMSNWGNHSVEIKAFAGSNNQSDQRIDSESFLSEYCISLNRINPLTLK